MMMTDHKGHHDHGHHNISLNSITPVDSKPRNLDNPRLNMEMADQPIIADRSPGQGFFEEYIQPCLAEFVGVTLFVFLGSTSGISTSTTIGVAVCHGFGIFILICAFGHISGGHFNPAVTLGVTLAGGLSPILTLPYIIAQLLGALLGALLNYGVLPMTLYDKANGMQTINTVSGVTAGQGFLTETILTFALVMVVQMTCVDSKGKHQLNALAVGSTVMIDILAGGALTGASMNPARSFGPAVVSSAALKSSKAWTYHWIYWVGPATGALVASACFRLFFGASDSRLILK